MAWLNIKNAASYCDVSPRTLETWLRNGLRSAKVGGCRRIKHEWLDEFLEKHEVVSEEDAIDEIVEQMRKNLRI